MSGEPRQEFEVTLPDPIYPRKRYPFLNKDLTVEEALRLVRWSDVGIWAAGTVGCWMFGFLRGHPARFATAGFMGTVGFTWGSFIALQNVRERVMGYSENSRELEWYRKRAGKNAQQQLQSSS